MGNDTANEIIPSNKGAENTKTYIWPNKEIQLMYRKPNILTIIKRTEMGWSSSKNI
jgi:hypothetical protein